MPSKREYFFGFKLHALVGDRGLFREVHLLEGRLHDLEGLAVMSFWGVSGNEVIGDRAYVNYSIEDELEKEGICLNPVRRVGESRYEGEWVEYSKRYVRRLIESVFSVVYRFLGLRPYAPTKEGIVLKVFLSVLAFNLYRGFTLRLWS
ncbi:MAG: transposase [Aquificota bacterium]|nr:transposase [Aquificota bacterium]